MIKLRTYREKSNLGSLLRATRAGCLFCAPLLLIALAGCQISSRVRTLPEEIESVHVPMYINVTYKPGIEELATRSTVEAFLADGRLEAVSPELADVIVQGVIMDFTDSVSSAESDDFPMMNTISAHVSVKLFSPDDRLEPLHVFKPFVINRSYVSDKRRSTLVVPEDALEGLMDAVGEKVVLEVLTGGFREIGKP
ncbi:hypothetical protein JW926_05675 [Candidatus Sumerlaeota bacterium]|nr:hypothetical protein [Candidatus Sumerlaeota bacterium]